MTSTPVPEVSYTVSRLTVPAGSTPAQFRARYEQAVPPLPVDQVTALVTRQAPWQEMLDLVATAAPLGFLIYSKTDVDPVVRLAGDQASGVAYLMGNHTLMERMFRYNPAILMYAPLHTVVWGDPDGAGYFTFDRPSDQFASFDRAEIADVGAELDHKLAVLLEHLGVPVPGALLAG